MKLFKNSDKRIVSSGLAIALGAALMLFVVLNFALLLGWLSTLFSYVTSVIWGLAIAYLLRPFTKFVRDKLPKRIRKENTRAKISAAITLVLMLVIIVALLVIVMPRLFASISDFLNNFDTNLESLKNTVKQLAANISFYEIDENSIDQFIGNSETLLKNAAGWVQSNYDKVLDVVTSVADMVMNFIIVISIAAYALFDMDNIKRNTKRVEKALIGDEKTERANNVIAKGDKLMTGFLSSNIVDALIIGVINFIFLTIADAPYTLILSILLAVFNLVPTFGPIAGGFVGSLIILLTDPPLLLPFIIFTLVLQQIDGNVLKPILFGDSTGLSGFWVMVAIVVGGKMFGILGMILGVPVCAFIAVILDETLARINGPGDLKKETQQKRRLSFKHIFGRKKNRKDG